MIGRGARIWLQTTAFLQICQGVYCQRLRRNPPRLVRRWLGLALLRVRLRRALRWRGSSIKRAYWTMRPVCWCSRHKLPLGASHVAPRTTYLPGRREIAAAHALQHVLNSYVLPLYVNRWDVVVLTYRPSCGGIWGQNVCFCLLRLETKGGENFFKRRMPCVFRGENPGSPIVELMRPTRAAGTAQWRSSFLASKRTEVVFSPAICIGFPSPSSTTAMRRARG